MGKVQTDDIRSIPAGTVETFKVDTAKDCYTAVTLAYQLHNKEPERGIRYKCTKDTTKCEVRIEAISVEHGKA